jgi:lipid II:glycine glycyltransferase (peptidoglycan interpeptide bridge formation enzyme)
MTTGLRTSSYCLVQAWPFGGVTERMALASTRDLGPGYVSEVDRVDETTWGNILREFDDANIYQTWPYASVRSGRGNVSRLLLKQGGQVVAMAQARIAKTPLVNLGIAYVHWGPLWRYSDRNPHEDVFRQAVRALRNEFACKRRLVLRLFPLLFDDGGPTFSAILEEEGYSLSGREPRRRTILMDVGPSLEALREGMRPHWKRELKVAERKNLEIVEGTGEALFDEFIYIYKEMVARKRFIEPNDIYEFRTVQAQLPEHQRMRILLCRSGSEPRAGLICSMIGTTAVYLFGATSNAGMKDRGSYALHWKLIEYLKDHGVSVYNLNGISPTTNPGPYKFKSDLSGTHGRDLHYLGQFDACTNSLNRIGIHLAETIKSILQNIRT